MEPNGYQFPQIVISSGEKQVLPDGKHLNSVSSPERQFCPDGNARRRSASLFWQVVALLLWFYLGTRGFRKMLWELRQFTLAGRMA